eukprot:GFYU01014707.1.p1 GENE.GFYU01014707.1~~GFYU01014707.1.p1  ORF type:complete len:388 (+),score=104.16 GFYU01014707.1:40-1203(+)
MNRSDIEEVEDLLREKIYLHWYNARDAFRSLDMTNNNVVTREDFKEALKYKLGYMKNLSEEAITELMDAFGSQDGNYILWKDFVKAVEEMPNPDAGGEVTTPVTHLEMGMQALRLEVYRHYHSLREAFLTFDTAGTGHLSKDEFTTVLKQFHVDMTPDEVNCVIERYDKDGTGRITYGEFVELMKRSHYSQHLDRQYFVSKPVTKSPVPEEKLGNTSAADADTSFEPDDVDLFDGKSQRTVYTETCNRMGVFPVSKMKEKFSKDLEWASRESYNFSDNNIGDAGLEAVIAALKRDRVVKTIDLSRTQIRDHGVKKLCQYLRECETLQKVILDGNSAMTFEAALSLLDAIEANERLVEVSVDETKIDHKMRTKLLRACEKNAAAASAK